MKIESSYAYDRTENGLPRFPKVGEWQIATEAMHLRGGWGQDWACEGVDLAKGQRYRLLDAGAPERPAVWEIEQTETRKGETMKLEHRETSNKGNGTAWRDIVRVDGEFAPAYVGEACDKKTADLFCAAPELLEVVARVFLHLNGLNATMRACSREYAASPVCNAINEIVKDAGKAYNKATEGGAG